MIIYLPIIAAALFFFACVILIYLLSEQEKKTILWRSEAQKLENETKLLKKQLDNARRNDQRDPKTGRFVKRLA